VNDQKVQYTSFAEEVWERLSRINAEDHVDQIPATGKRPAISYLAWHKAWTLLKTRFPASTYSHKPDLWHPDGTVEVEVDVVIAHEFNFNNITTTNARLGVMDSYFNPIKNPTARQINDARQRALVKALAFAGLGLNLWSDSVIPVGKLEDPISYDQLEELTKLIKETETDEHTFLNWCECESLDQLPVHRYASAFGLLQAKLRKRR
jgi:hypothetical protein